MSTLRNTITSALAVCALAALAGCSTGSGNNKEPFVATDSPTAGTPTESSTPEPSTPTPTPTVMSGSPATTAP
ncbi:hypothetical protein [Gryllotalpicola ginsengisoli]|uniref:hypothetical protein n=1 Tax=Gryllotalpicola ginsengisoli TaxID=444608 RepID=UPI0003B72C8D|nr:hypothetical protein [Gryllotalpicola ginsengisoli]